MDISLIWKFLVAAAIGEALWQTLKLVWEPDATKKGGKFHPDKLGVLAIGILIAFGASLDLFEAVGIPLSIPYVGVILTGVLLSRGAGFVHDLFTYLKSLKEIVLNKADIANMEREKVAVKTVGKNLTEGTKINIDTSKKEDNKNEESTTDKVKDMLTNVAGSMNKVVKVIRSHPTVTTEEPKKEVAVEKENVDVPETPTDNQEE